MRFQYFKAGQRVVSLARAKPTPFWDWEKAALDNLPAEYQKFWSEWKEKEPTAVHWVPEQGKFKKNPKSGQIEPVQNVPIPVFYPREHNFGIWGGEGVIRGYQKRHPMKRRVSHFWFPVLHETVVYSEILDKRMIVTVTERTLKLIDENYGFDFYLLKTPACDLKSVLAVRLKGRLLLALVRQDLYPDQPEKRKEVLEKYKDFIVPESEAEWYGLTLKEAEFKQKELQEKIPPVPLKLKYRQELFEKLKEGLGPGQEVDAELDQTSSWLSKLNPFQGKKDNP